ncbi:hypothetical protein E2C01_048217 [Portunus trituberculatus]|uniref:Uncharacterized protein n=1 Tax=Portunus trituberculatus TaxID=210409 RepID=A0A5B7GA04_PORTR|nr:hypothetical protein [Portunus trituberculatus]
MLCTLWWRAVRLTAMRGRDEGSHEGSVGREGVWAAGSCGGEGGSVGSAQTT